jgi:UDPglucose--hexose-1-phosphate uridylyltransferase
LGELRKDYFRERYVIISPERAKRPHDFNRTTPQASKATPFSPGNESLLPPIIAQYPEGSSNDDWRFRVVENKFPVVSPGDTSWRPRTPVTANEIFTWADAYGHHEIIIEGRDDNVPFAKLGAQGIADAIRIGIERVRKLGQQEGIAAVAYFKNEGLDAGASIAHPHSQVIATAIVPPAPAHLNSLHKDLRASFGFSPMYKVLDKERGGARMIRESKHFAALCPYASRYPMETMLVPLRDSNTYLDMSDEEIVDLAQQLFLILDKLSSIGAPYNIEWMHYPGGALHWHLIITPRLSTWAGYEIETNIIVNPIPPEHAAGFYRA